MRQVHSLHDVFRWEWPRRRQPGAGDCAHFFCVLTDLDHERVSVDRQYLMMETCEADVREYYG